MCRPTEERPKTAKRLKITSFNRNFVIHKIVKKCKIRFMPKYGSQSGQPNSNKPVVPVMDEKFGGRDFCPRKDNRP